MSPPVVTINNLVLTLGAKTLLEIDRLVIPAGTTAVLGPNGAGKTTLLRSVATIDPVDPGVLTIGGLDPADRQSRIALRRRLGYAAQADWLPDRMRVDEFCDYVAALREIGPRRRRTRWVQWVLAELGLSDRGRDRIDALSGGLRRRLLIAQSLIGHPDLVVLDEPLVSLDADQRSSVVRQIAASADHRSTLVATHHADELGAVCRHVIVVRAGRVVYAGPPDRLAARAEGRVVESAIPIDHANTRAVGPDLFRTVDASPSARPPGAAVVAPTLHDGYLALLADCT